MDSKSTLSSPVTRREFHARLALLSAAGIGVVRAAEPARAGAADPELQAGGRIVRRDAESLRALPLEGVPPAFTPTSR
jgi:hypothetical protein